MLNFPDFGQKELKAKLASIEGTDEKFVHEVAGCLTTFGSGGAHYGEKGIWEGDIVDIDFASLYPHIMVVYNLASRKIKNPNRIKDLMEQRLEFKKMKDSRANSLKIVINSLFGVSGDPNSEIYDSEACFSVCACGQLILTKLTEHIQDLGTVINLNTDGCFMLLNKGVTHEELEKRANEAAEEIGIPVEFDYYVKMVQRSVNEYIALASDGSYHSKGKIWKERNELDNDCPIIQKALINYIRFGGYISFIEQDNDLMDFQMIVRKGRAYDALYQKYVSPDTRLNDTNRVFACTHRTGSIIKAKGEKVYKYPSLPDDLKVDNGDVRDKKCPIWLDKSYYIGKVEDILDEWGLSPKAKKELTLEDFW